MCALYCILDAIDFFRYIYASNCNFYRFWSKTRPTKVPRWGTRMKKCVQNALRKRARRLIEPLSAQIAFKTAQMVPNGGKRALEMRQNRVQKSNHIV